MRDKKLISLKKIHALPDRAKVGKMCFDYNYESLIRHIVLGSARDEAYTMQELVQMKDSGRFLGNSGLKPNNQTFRQRLMEAFDGKTTYDLIKVTYVLHSKVLQLEEGSPMNRIFYALPAD